MAITLQRIKQLEEESRLRNQTYKYLILPIFQIFIGNLRFTTFFLNEF